jgi:hypothetical protein
MSDNESKRSADYVKTAKFRAAAVAYINTLEEWIPGGNVLVALAPTMDELGIPPQKAHVQLRNLGEVGLIAAKREGKNFFYRGANGDPTLAGKPGSMWKKTALKPETNLELKEITDKQLAAIKAEVNKAKKEFPVPGLAPEPDIKLDVVKATNRVRITVQGLIIEIGVVEK